MFRRLSNRGFTPRHLLRLVLTLSFALTAPACGAGGALEDLAGDLFGSRDDGKAALEITTTSVPAGKPGVAYDPTQLTTVGAEGPVIWTIAGGTLPPGLRLTADGRVTGVPSEPGFYEFTALASDGAAADEQSYAIAVDVFGATVTDGLYCGDAWSGRPVTLRTAGAAGAVRFEVAVGDGRFAQIDTAAGTANYVPGMVMAGGTTDRLRVTDTGTGEVLEIDVTVVPNPTENHVARFGSTDVWYLDWDAKHGRHPFASDYQAALAYLGLRGANSTDVRGTEADRLVDLIVRVRTLRALNKMYLREADGTDGARGLAISFPLVQPGAGYYAPGPGGYMGRRENGYSVMALCDQSGSLGAQGVAYQDDAGNGRHEHNASGAVGEMGVFINYVAGTVDRAYRLYRDELKENPVSDEDIPALKDLLYDRAGTGARYDMLRYQADALARSIAFVAGHEIGHSIGLPHLFAYTSGAIMNGHLLIGPGADYFFVEESLAILRRSLGTAGTGTAAMKVAALSAPDGGVHVCGHCNHQR